MGRRPADLVIRDGRWVNVHSAEILDHTDIAVLGSRIAYCGPDAGPMIGPRTRVIQARGRYLVPGLLDAHVHIESSMLTVTQFARAVLPCGTTGVFADPHEIANVLGLAGVRWMAEGAEHTPLQVYVQVPSCVPAAPGLETTAAELGPAEVAEALAWPEAIGLGEVMNYPGVVAGEEGVHAKIAAALQAGVVVGGHYASPDLGRAFHAYAAGGPADCHEGTRPEDALARVRQGMKAILRQGSAWKDLAEGLRAITEHGISSRHVLLATDDRHAGTILVRGHMDDVVREAIVAGIPPLVAIQMATLNTAEHFGVAQDVGSIAPGRSADLLLVPDLARLSADVVIAGGEVVAEAGQAVYPLSPVTYPAWAQGTVRLARPLTAEDFATEAPGPDGEADVWAIEVVENQAPTRKAAVTLPVRDGKVELVPGVAYAAVVERHRGTGRIGRGFVRGFDLGANCALASTVAHDSHQLLIVGADRNAMARAGNRVAEGGGGVCLVRGGDVRAWIPLPIAGLLSTAPAEEVAGGMEDLHRGLRECGCALQSAFMTFSLLALPVIPALRLTDHGLVDVESGSILPLFRDG
jgi:adenine deaminase